VGADLPDGTWSINEYGSCMVLWASNNRAFLYELKLELPYRTTAVAQGAGGARALAVLQGRSMPPANTSPVALARAASGSPPASPTSASAAAAAAQDVKKGNGAVAPPPLSAAEAKLMEQDTITVLSSAERKFIRRLRNFWAHTVWSM
jgi:hypothetical protein